MPPPLHRTEGSVSPELALVDRSLVSHARTEPREREPAQPSLRVVHGDVEGAIRRICELSDVNPPKRSRRARALALSGVATLWLEALVIAAAQLHVGL